MTHGNSCLQCRKDFIEQHIPSVEALKNLQTKAIRMYYECVVHVKEKEEEKLVKLI